jgi:hypothetical protein
LFAFQENSTKIFFTFSARPFAASNEKLWVFACSLVRLCSRAAARTHARTHARTMPVAYILPNLGKMISLLKKIFGKKATKNIWHFEHKRLKDSAAVGA